MSECYSTERRKFLTLTCLQLSGQLSYADRATGHRSTVEAAATAMRVKRDSGNASEVDGYGGEGVGVIDVSSVKAKGRKEKIRQRRTFPGPKWRLTSRSERGMCAVGLGSMRFERSWFAETTENGWTGQMDQTEQSRGQNTWSVLIGVSSCLGELTGIYIET